jgi:hypothetical protein
MTTPTTDSKTTSTDLLEKGQSKEKEIKVETKAQSKKITDEEKKELVELYETHYKLDQKSLPTIKEDEKSKEILQKILVALKEKHRIFKFFNTNKLLVITKHIQTKEFPKKKATAKKPETRESIVNKIEKLKQKLTAFDSGVIEAFAAEDDIKEEDL